MFQEFKDLLNLLQVDFDALTGELSVLHNESKVAFQEVGKACVEEQELGHVGTGITFCDIVRLALPPDGERPAAPSARSLRPAHGRGLQGG